MTFHSTLTLETVTFGYGTSPALKSGSFTARYGKFTAIIGPMAPVKARRSR